MSTESKKCIIDRLERATPEEVLEAEVYFCKHSMDNPGSFIMGLRRGFKLAQPDAWMHVAPVALYDKIIRILYDGDQDTFQWE